MTPLSQLEKKLDALVNKVFPLQLPEDIRKSIAGALWWLALIGGLAQLWSASGLWRLGHLTDQFADWANSLSTAYGTGEHVDKLGFFFYVSVSILAIDGLLLLAAVPGLKRFSKARGWDFLYYGMLVNLVYAVFRLFSGVSGVSGFLSGLIGAACGAYFIFQVRKFFTGQAHATDKVTELHPATPSTPEAPKHDDHK